MANDKDYTRQLNRVVPPSEVDEVASEFKELGVDLDKDTSTGSRVPTDFALYSLEFTETEPEDKTKEGVKQLTISFDRPGRVLGRAGVLNPPDVLSKFKYSVNAIAARNRITTNKEMREVIKQLTET